MYGVIFWQDEGELPLTQRNVTVFADGEVDRSPCGSGTSARLALLDAAGRLPRGAELRHLSIVGSSFSGRVVDEAEVAGPGRGRHRGDRGRLPHRREHVRARPRRPAAARASCSASRLLAVRCRAWIPRTTRSSCTSSCASARRGRSPSWRALPHSRHAAAPCRYLDDERWRDGFDDWWRHSFRKVCLRAEPREWEAVRELDHERVGDVACLPPVRRSTRDRVLARMQTLSEEAGALPPPAARARART